MVEKGGRRRGGNTFNAGEKGEGSYLYARISASLIKELTSSLPHHLAIFAVHISKPSLTI